MSQSTESVYSFTTKVDNDLLTVRGQTPDEFKTNVQGLVESGALDYVRALQKHAVGDVAGVVQQSIPQAQVIQEQQAPQGPPPEWAQAAPQQPQQSQQGWGAPAPQPVPQQAAPASYGQPSAVPSCAHGARVFKSGVNKQGKPWQAWFCPSPDRNAQCDPEWVR